VGGRRGGPSVEVDAGWFANRIMTASILTQLCAWCLSQGMPLDCDVVLDPDTVERFVSVG